ncbi:EAF [Lepeophtheirus salmonis]|uniref:Ell-associated factor Eaf n=1 Tax=Lepeophtheirus salmonis TaxID=72036 RepID=A0A7R8D6K7_LEPSM|nr:EAF [Lepeophtheirus salmonis]CAF3016936.1 EAF [Lepeophtheirus salmonis]
MGEKLAQLGLVSGEVRELNIGSSFRENSTFHTIRYDFKPASVDPSKMGVLSVGGDSNSSVSVNVPHMNGTGNTHFGGHAKESNKRECILIFDAETGEFTLGKNINISQQQPPPPPPNHYPSSSFKHSSQHKKHSIHRSKPISPAHRIASPVPSRPKANSSMVPSHHPPPSNHHHHQTPASQYKKAPEEFSLDLDDEFDIMKSLQPTNTTNNNAFSSSTTSSSSTYHRQQQQAPVRNQPEKKPPPPPPRPPSPQAQASTGDSSDSSSSDSSSGSDSDSDDEDFQEVVSSENKNSNGGGGSMMMMAPSMPSFSTSPNPHSKENHQQPTCLQSNSGPPSMKAILNDDLQLSSESDDDSD